MCDSTNMKPGLERITEKEKEDNVRKQGYTMTFPTKEEVNFALGLKHLTCHPMAKSQAAILKTSWKTAPLQRPVIFCQISPPYITRFT